MFKFLQSLQFRRIFLLIDTIFQILVCLLIFFVYLSLIGRTKDEVGLGNFVLFLYCSFLLFLQFFSIVCQSFLQRELVKIRLTYLTSLLFLFVIFLMMFQLPDFRSTFSNNVNSKSLPIFFYLISIFFYPILSIYHCNLLFKNQEKK